MKTTLRSHARIMVAAVLLLWGHGQVAVAQTADSIAILNLLRAQVSPAANLLGTLPSDIHQPTDVTAFAVSLQNATNGFSGLPVNFAVDVAPFWLLGRKGRGVAFADLRGEHQRFGERFLLSAAVKGNRTRAGADSSAQVATGLRVSLLRGRFDSAQVANVQAYLDHRETLKDRVRNAIAQKDTTLSLFSRQIRLILNIRERDRTKQDSTRLTELQTAIFGIRQQIETAAIAQADKQLAAELKAIEADPVRRYGCKLDLSAGLAWAFQDARFNGGKLFRTGLWLTGGYEWKTGHALLGVLRLLYNPNTVFADDKKQLGTTEVTTFDAGAKYNFTAAENPFTASTEFVYRSVLNQSQLPSSWRWTVNLNYAIAKNSVLTLALGRDFDRTFKQDGNVIALLNLITGLGSARSLKK